MVWGLYLAYYIDKPDFVKEKHPFTIHKDGKFCELKFTRIETRLGIIGT